MIVFRNHYVALLGPIRKGSAISHTAVILAAGFGSRLTQLTRGRPKSLLTLNNRSLLQWHLDHLGAVGIADVVVVVGYMKEEIREHLRPYSSSHNLEFVENPHFEEGGNAYSFYLGMNVVGGNSLTLDADLVYTRDILEGFVRNPVDSLMLVGGGSQDDIESTKVLVDAKNRVRKTVDKRALSAAELSQLRFAGEAMGALRFSEEGREQILDLCERFFELDENKTMNWEHVLNLFLETAEMYSHYDPSNAWIEIDTPEDYAEAKLKFIDAQAESR